MEAFCHQRTHPVLCITDNDSHSGTLILPKHGSVKINFVFWQRLRLPCRPRNRVRHQLRGTRLAGSNKRWSCLLHLIMHLVHRYVCPSCSHRVPSIPYCLGCCGKQVQVLPCFNDSFHQIFETREAWAGVRILPQTGLSPNPRNCVRMVPLLSNA